MLPWGARWVEAVWIAATALSALRLSWLVTAQMYAIGDVRRHHLESTAFVLAALLLVRAASVFRTHAPDVRSTAAPPWRWWALLVVAFSIGLYWPALRIGLLSDDFVLLDWAGRHTFIPREWDFIRPVPLVLWAGLQKVLAPAAVPIALHALNVAIHTVNALLLAGLAVRLGLDRGRALIAAFLFIAFPLNVEPVAWSSGVFDVLLLTFTLLASHVSLRMPERPLRTAGYIAALTVLALATKETAVAIPVVLVAVLTGTRAARSAYWIPALAAAMTVLYVSGRFLTHTLPPTEQITVTGYQLKELLSRPFGALSVPFHQRVLDERPFVALIAAAPLPLMLAHNAWQWTRRPGAARRAIGLALWIVAGVGPLLTLLFVGPDLQGSRYLYVSSAGWALLLAQSLPDARRTPGRYAYLLIAALFVLTFGLATRSHLSIWIEAGLTRDRVLHDVLAMIPACRDRAVVPVAKHHLGAYVFANGLTEALRASQVDASPGPSGSARVQNCEFVPTEAGAGGLSEDRSGGR